MKRAEDGRIAEDAAVTRIFKILDRAIDSQAVVDCVQIRVDIVQVEGRKRCAAVHEACGDIARARAASEILNMIDVAPAAKRTGPRKNRRCSESFSGAGCANDTLSGVISAPVLSRASLSITASANSARAGCNGVVAVSRTSSNRLSRLPCVRMATRSLSTR